MFYLWTLPCFLTFVVLFNCNALSSSCTFKWTRLALPKSGVDECFGDDISTLLGCYKLWHIISSTLWGHHWRKMAKSAIIWSTCGHLYQVLRCSLWAYLNMWSLPNLLCVRFWDLLKMNVALALCLSWRANFESISPPIFMCVWKCFHKTSTTSSLFLILRP